MDCRFWQPENAALPIDVREAGSFISASAVQSENTPSPMAGVVALRFVTLVPAAKDVMLSGSVTEVSAEHCANISALMEVSLGFSGITMLASDVQPLKAPFPMALILS